jgi:hypothetical protein
VNTCEYLTSFPHAKSLIRLPGVIEPREGAPPTRTTVVVGDIVRVADGDYMYGSGELVLRVTAIGVPQQLDGEQWLHLRGHQRFHTGVETAERYALVRAAGVRIQFRRGETTP